MKNSFFQKISPFFSKFPIFLGSGKNWVCVVEAAASIIGRQPLLSGITS
ncbi:MAG: hypothetical protein HUK11_00720 [Muribaculaceae bacterium]|nr:hypothetical protein [Muribaculaceae bacterium]